MKVPNTDSLPGGVVLERVTLCPKQIVILQLFSRTQTDRMKGEEHVPLAERVNSHTITLRVMGSIQAKAFPIKFEKQ
jgi:hypothetical protein